MSEKYHGQMYAKAQNLRRVVRAAYDRALEQVDVLAMPTSPVTAPKQSELEVLGTDGHGVMDLAGNTAPFNTTGHPALSIPCGKSDGLPVGLMLVGRHFDDATSPPSSPCLRATRRLGSHVALRSKTLRHPRSHMEKSH